MLDASVPGMVFSSLDGSSDFVQVGDLLDEPAIASQADQASAAADDSSPQADLSTMNMALVGNTPPSNVQVLPTNPTLENGFGHFFVTFDDPDISDTHTIEINWGDGSAAETFAVAPGNRFIFTLHQYLDDNPSGTPTDFNSVQAKVRDSFGEKASGSGVQQVINVTPFNLQIDPLGTIDENSLADLQLSFEDDGTLDTHIAEIDWGDGSALETVALTPGSRSLNITHQYLDDDPTGTSSDDYTVLVKLKDDDGGEVAGSQTVTVDNVAPFNVAIAPLGPVGENSLTTLQLTFDDPGTLDTHTVDIDWGDGFFTTGSAVGQSFTTDHVYADNGNYTIKARVGDDDLGVGMGSTQVIVNNVAPTLMTVGNQTLDEGQLILLPNIGTFTDPGFDNPLNVNDPSNGGEVEESFTFNIDWGDGTPLDAGAGVIDMMGSPGVDTAGSFGGNHIYADNGVYTVRVTLFDDDGGVAQSSFQATVNNVAPTLMTVGNQTLDEGQLILLPNIGTFTDPGFDNPLNVNDPSNGGEVEESFTFNIDWGDGTPLDAGAGVIDMMGSPGVDTAGSFGGNHIYADNGVYTVRVTLFDDDGGVAQSSFQATVNNVAPTLMTVGNQTLDEGQLILLPNIGTFTDPGFDNPLNVNDPSNGGEVEESFTFNIDWGDGTPLDAGAGVIDMMGSPGVDTAGSFGGNHIYADNGVYTVRVTLFDDDGGVAQSSFQATVNNVAPTLMTVGNQTLDEGQLILLPNIGTFTDPGFDNPLNVNDPSNGGEVEESFTFNIDWGDGTPLDAGAGVIDMMGSPGVDTAGSFDGNHIYADNGIYTVTVTLLDDDGGVAQTSFQTIVNNVDPTLAGLATVPAVTEGQAFTLASLGVRIEDPGFDNPDNPLQAGGSVETFTATTVDWGDGTTPDLLTIGTRTNGGPFVPTTAELQHAPHTFADNGSYTVTLLISDDDGGLVSRTLTIDVTNVAPSLTLTSDPQVVDEGSLLTITSLGTFTDPGFDNLLNVHDPSNGGETQELFDFTIDWGDGTVETGQLPAAVTTGSPGVLTTGVLGEFSHTYADNNVDSSHNIIDYTVTVTLRDDDGDSTFETIPITVNNVAPTLTMLVGTDIDSSGETILSGSFFDPGADTYVLEIDWSDGSVQQVPLSGPTPIDFSVSHQYSGPPNPQNPAADVEINALLLDDDAGDDTGQVFISNPGEGTHPVRIDTTPQVPLLVFPRNLVGDQFVQTTNTNVELAQASELPAAVGDTKSIGDRYFELRVIGPEGVQSEGIKLKPDVLDDLPGLFRKLPDSRYAIYLVRTETNTRRLVLEVYVRNGKVIDPGDDTEGARDRPPTEETAQPMQQPEVLQQPQDELPVVP